VEGGGATWAVGRWAAFEASASLQGVGRLVLVAEAEEVVEAKGRVDIGRISMHLLRRIDSHDPKTLQKEGAAHVAMLLMW